jgi:polyhydroxyalkanoate synthase
MSKGLDENFKRCEEIMADFTRQYDNIDLDPFKLSGAYKALFEQLAKDPQKLIETNMAYMQDAMKLYQSTMLGLMGQSQEPVIEPEKGDRRFKHDDWNEQPAFDCIKQSYLLASKWMRSVVSETEGMDEKTAKKVEFFTERYIDALSPTNFSAMNPAVLEKIRETRGANLVHGLKNLLTDLEKGEGQLRIRMTDVDAFELGENVGTTPGKIVFQNRMMQLIQYEPTTEKVQKRPLLVIPPWINKYYILDLQEKNSLLKWLVDQGHTVFVVSWINPDESYRDVGFDEYMTEGVLTALDAIEQATGERDVNAIGYCIGGTLLATTLAYMQANDDDRIKRATFFTTMLDFSEPGDLGVFVGEEELDELDKTMQEAGYLDGTGMAGTFNLLRANDLIWSFYINNYLLGNDPRPFDLLYWNSDSTRMPAKMHSWYMRNFYLKNLLCKPNGVTVAGTPIDLSKIKTPACFVSTVEDHIAPWKSTYMGARLFSGPVRFILGGSGHIAGVINPPEAEKYGYRTVAKLPEDAEAWAEKAKPHEGSWWPEWQKWVKPGGGKAVAARIPGDGKLDVIEAAPGSYAKHRL